MKNQCGADFKIDLNSRGKQTSSCYSKHQNLPKGLFTRYNFVACDKLTTGLQQELYRVNQTYNSLTTVEGLS